MDVLLMALLRVIFFGRNKGKSRQSYRFYCVIFLSRWNRPVEIVTAFIG